MAEKHIANRMCYRVYDTRSGHLHTEYFDPLTTSFSDHGDYELIFKRLLKAFNVKM
jgi:hypothetical protein